MTTEIHGCVAYVMKSGKARQVTRAEDSRRHSTEGPEEIQIDWSVSSVMRRSTYVANVGSFEMKMIDQGSSLEQRRRTMTSRKEGAMLCSVPSTISTCGRVTMARASSNRRIWLNVNWLPCPVTVVVRPAGIRSISSSSSTNCSAH